MSSSAQQQQLAQFRTKYEQEVKKNNNLLKMNSNLMRQNESYLNCFSLLKKWSNSIFTRFGNDNQSVEEFQDSCIDVEQQGEEFVNKLCEFVQKKIDDLNLQIEKYQKSSSNQQLFVTTQKLDSKLRQQYTQQQKQCPDCNRWKQLYIKQTKQTSKLQKLIDDSSVFHTQKQLNFTKLKDDTMQLLQGYLKLYRKQLQVKDITISGQLVEDSSSKSFLNSNSNNNSTLNQNYYHHNNKQTVRPKEKSKQKRPNSNSGHKGKKVTIQNNNSNQPLLQATTTKQPTPFSKQKTSRHNTKYTIQLSPQKSFASLHQQKVNNLTSLKQPSQLSKCLNDILSSYSELSKNLQQQNNQLKQQLKDLMEILNIYRQRERNQIMFR